MEPTIHCITLPVSNLKHSILFYRSVMNFYQDETPETADHAPQLLHSNLYLVLVNKTEFDDFAQLAGARKHVTGQPSCILSYFAGNKEEVQSLIEKARVAGAPSAVAPEEKSWGYAGFFTDPDGHIWEVLYNTNLNDEE